MLSSLRIQNLALVDDLTLELSAGYNAISGETGAGKSILIGALNLLLGERASREWIRAGRDHCSVEALIDAGKLGEPLGVFLDDHGLSRGEGGALILKRTFALSGANRQFVNGSPTTLTVLEQLGRRLVDVHGPHDHQSLLQPQQQLQILDRFGGLAPLQRQFAAVLAYGRALEQERAALLVDGKTLAQQLDLLRFQVEEIAAARLDPNEEVELEREYRRASNASTLAERARDAHALLADEETGVLAQTGRVGKLLADLQALDSSADPLVEGQRATADHLQELLAEVTRYLDHLDIDPARLAALGERFNLIQTLKRKYGPTLSGVIEQGAQTEIKIESFEKRESELERIAAALAANQSELRALGERLTSERSAIIPKLRRAALGQLRDLGFKQSAFEIHLTTEPISPAPLSRISGSGFDQVEFHFAPNPGEPSRPLRAIASSGELARVMLALKTALADEDDIPILIFDEVDANVGGETARKVGEKMRLIARHRQVLCVTHLAPVAAFAESHFVVSKELEGNRTQTRLRLLKAPERIEELARMLGGASATALKHAEELLTRAGD